LKKRKTAALAKKIEAQKQMAEKQLGLPSDIDGLDKLDDSKHNESSTAVADAEELVKAEEMAKAEARRRRFAKPEEGEKERKDVGSNGGDGGGGDETEDSTLKQPLPSVAENDIIDGAKLETKDTDNDSFAPDGSSSKPMLFGSSATLTVPPLTFGGLQAPPIQSEPDCPKPSFFGTSSSTAPNPVFGGAGTSASPFGGAGLSISPTPFGDAAVRQLGGSTAAQGGSQTSGSGAFLNLTPPGITGAGTPGKFVFGKSANITLAVPAGASPLVAAQTLASFGKSGFFGATPFGGGFGGPPTSAFGASPFGGGGGGGGGGDSSSNNKRALPTPDEGEQPDAKLSRTEEEDEDGEIHDEGETVNATNAAAEA
jgi:hypothetical protein